jgi:hypothetical protein
MQRSDGEDASLRWQAFLIDGFEDWLPLATVASTNLLKSTAREVLRGMISDFYFADGIKQTTEDITNFLEGFAFTANAIVRDPKTGELLGNMRDLVRNEDGTYTKKAVKPAKPVFDAVREKKRLRREAKAKAAAANVVNSEKDVT